MRLGDLQSNTPEHLLDSTWKSLGWILGLCSCKTDKLGTGEGKGSNDENRAETPETVLESSWVVPKASAPIFTVLATGWATTANQDDSDDHEDDCSAKLENGRPELFLRIAESTEDVNEDDEGPEDRDPYGDADILVPVRARKRDDCQLQRQYNDPLEDLACVRTGKHIEDSRHT